MGFWPVSNFAKQKYCLINTGANSEVGPVWQTVFFSRQTREFVGWGLDGGGFEMLIVSRRRWYLFWLNFKVIHSKLPTDTIGRLDVSAGRLTRHKVVHFTHKPILHVCFLPPRDVFILPRIQKFVEAGCQAFGDTPV